MQDGIVVVTYDELFHFLCEFDYMIYRQHKIIIKNLLTSNSLLFSSYHALKLFEIRFIIAFVLPIISA
jgi:hypothetical protein